MNAVFQPSALPAKLPLLSSARLGWLLFGYFALHVVLRTLVSDSLELDEAEQILWTQQLAWGYGAQPPLYTWLQWLVFQLTGPSVLGLALLKNLLLAATYTFTYLAARLVTRAPLAFVCAASLMLLPQIAWESQRDLTHSVLLTTLVSATWLTVLHLVRRPAPIKYAALGLVIGLGLLSKYSYAMFVTVLCLATLSAGATRHIWRSLWMLAAILITMAVVAPHAMWLMQHAAEVSDSLAGKLAPAEQISALAARAKGMLSLSVAVLSFLGLWCLVTAVVFGRLAWKKTSWPVARPALNDTARDLWRAYFVWLAVLLVGMVIVGGVTHFKDRWMQPFLVCVPMVYFSCMPHLATSSRLIWMIRAAMAMVLVVIVMIALRPEMSGSRPNSGELNWPVDKLAQELREQGFDGRGDIVTSHRVLGGVLSLQFPQARVHLAPVTMIGNEPELLIETQSDVASIQKLAAKIRPPRPVGGEVATIVLDHENAGPKTSKAVYHYSLTKHPE